MFNRYGGMLENAAGIPDDQVRRAARSAVCKVNVASDGYLSMTAAVRKVLHDRPEKFDPRTYLGPAREALVEVYAHKNREVFGSAGRA
jgi:fructose-bisphosphate aldolase class II